MTLSKPKDDIRILLLEGVHHSAVEAFKADGYTNIVHKAGALDGAELEAELAQAHMVGIRSRTQLTDAVLQKCKKLLAVGCFCIGTNQVDLKAAALKGVPVFNAPFSNTRSVAELIIAEIVMLLRGIPQKNAALQRDGSWLKTASDSYEIRGKTLGIIGYGHIGMQVSLAAEALGMNVIYYDVENKLSLGNASAEPSLKSLLNKADVVTLHVPADPSTVDMIGEKELKQMKKGSYLINASRGNVVVIEALAEALKSGHIAGAAVDVFPTEPKAKGEKLDSPLVGMDNVLLTPHIGGSTQEAQQNIGAEVAQKLIKYSNNGSTVSATNFVEVNLPQHDGKHRILHIHHNQPGVLSALNKVFAATKVNIAGQYLQTNAEIGYVVTDIDAAGGDEVPLEDLKAIDGTIKTRVLY